MPPNYAQQAPSVQQFEEVPLMEHKSGSTKWNEKENMFEKLLAENSVLLGDNLCRSKGKRFISSPCLYFRINESGSYDKCTELSDHYCHQCEGKKSYANPLPVKQCSACSIAFHQEHDLVHVTQKFSNERCNAEEGYSPECVEIDLGMCCENGAGYFKRHRMRVRRILGDVLATFVFQECPQCTKGVAFYLSLVGIGIWPTEIVYYLICRACISRGSS